jgi:DNA helicase HerA-like ATPase
VRQKVRSKPSNVMPVPEVVEPRSELKDQALDDAPITSGASRKGLDVSSLPELTVELPTVNEQEVPSVVKPDILVGSHELSPQFGLIGRHSESTVAIDLTGCNTVSLFGVQGFGKSYTLGVIAEMATTEVPGINVLPAPLATVIFHYHKSEAYPPEFASANMPNNKSREVERLLHDYGAHPHGVRDIVLLTPEAKLGERRDEFPGLEVHPIKFGSGELGAESWKFLLGAYGNDSLYLRQLVAIMRRHREDLTFQRFRDEILSADLSQQARRLAEDRLNLAEPYIDDRVQLGSLIRPGRTIIVDLRDPWIEKEEALGLFVVMMRIFASTKSSDNKAFNKLVIFDEAHKYISESELIGQVVETIREMRHQGTSVVIASQDPLSVPRAIIELTSILVLHRITSPQWLKHLKSAIIGLEDISEEHLAALQAGDALVWAQRSTDRKFSQRPYKVRIRPRFSLHGGGTKTAIPNITIR